MRSIMMVTLRRIKIEMRIDNLALMLRSSRIRSFPVRISVLRHAILLTCRYSS